MPGRAEYQIAVDKRGAEQSLTEFEGKLRGATGSAQDFGKATKTLNDKLGSAATAVSGVSGAMNTMSSQANAAVGALGNLAGAVASGGVVGAALAGVGVVVAEIAGAFEAAKKRAQEFDRQMSELARAGLNDAATELRALTQELGHLGLGSLEARVSTQKENKRIAEERSRLLKGEIADIKGELLPLQANQLTKDGERAERLKSALATMEAQAKAARAQAEQAGVNLKILEQIEKKTDSIEKAKKAKKAGRSATADERRAREAEDRADLEAQQASEREAAAFREARRQEEMDNSVRFNKFALAQEDAERAERLAKEEQLQRAIRILREAERDAFIRDTRLRAAAWADLGATLVDTTQTIADTAGSQILTLFDDLAAKDEEAGRKFAANFMRNIGQQLVGIGIRSMFEGGAKLFNPVTAPAGVAEMGFGATAIAAGIGLGAAGSFAAPQASAPTGGDRSPRPSPSGGGGGPTNVTFVYGVGGPNPEDAARAVNRVQRDGRRLLGDGLRRGR